MKFGKSVRLSGMLFLTGGFFLVELVVGYMTGSMALIADSFHMLSDVIALIIGLLSVRISRRKSEKNTFGWARAEVLGALVNAVFLCALCFSIFVESIQRFVEGVEIDNPRLVLIVGGVGLGVNVIGLFLFHDHSHGGHGHSHGHDLDIDVEHGHDHQSHNHNHDHSPVANGGTVGPKKKIASGSQMNMKGVFIHVAGDALGSVVVIIAACVIEFTNWEYRNYIDPAMSLLSVCVILAMTIPLLHSSALVLLQTVPLHIKARDVKARLEKVEGVLAVHELHIWQLAGNRIVASVHIWFKNYHEYKLAASRLKELFHNEGIHSTTIQPEFEDFDDTGRCSITPLDPAFCGLICPEDQNCEENMCCKPSRSGSRLDSASQRPSLTGNIQRMENGLREHLHDIPLHTHQHSENSHIPHVTVPENLDSCGTSPNLGHDNRGFLGSAPSIMVQPATPAKPLVDANKPFYVFPSPSGSLSNPHRHRNTDTIPGSFQGDDDDRL